IHQQEPPSTRPATPRPFRVASLPAGNYAGSFRNRNMIENEKIDCIDSLIFGLNRTAQWHQKMAAKYPSDPRNARAAECLSRLATDASKLSDQDWLQLQS